MGAEQIELLARERMSQFGQTFFETPKLWRQSSDWLSSKVVAIHGQEHLQAALDNPRGTILLIPHQGSWEALGLWVATHTTMTALYEPPKIAELERWIKSSRERSGAILVPTNVRGVAALLKALRRGETTAVHNLIQKSGSQALMCAALRVAGGWELHFMPTEEAINSADQQISLDALNRGVETIVALAPSQYQWEYKRFRARPEGFPSIYPKGS